MTAGFPHRPLPSATAYTALRVGLFDSGLGGLSMLPALRGQLPGATFIYAADSRFAPYGERSDGYVVSRSKALARFLIDQGAHMVVVACNTATAAAIQELRHVWPDAPFIGVEPGLKPAVTQSPHGRVGVLATPMTLRSEKFRRLLEAHRGHAEVTLQPCPGLAAEIERGALDSPALRALVARFTRPLVDANVDTVVLGCTHYPLIAPLFQQALPAEVRLVDTSAAVARHARRLADVLVASQASDAPPGASDVALWTTLDPDHLGQLAQQWLGLPPDARLLRATAHRDTEPDSTLLR